MFSKSDFLMPQILAVEKDFFLVYKPPRFHSSPLANSRGENILSWCSVQFPEIADLPGRKAGEGGLLHRLDYETHGILLLARNMPGMEALLQEQGEGKILKEYSALTAKCDVMLPGFPPMRDNLIPNLPFRIQSAFRPYGPGRKAVRPVLIYRAEGEKQRELYTSEIAEVTHLDERLACFRLRIWRGFRHQIRSHLAWLGMPILNDSLYGGASSGEGFLALRACSISFLDPSTGKERSYSIPPLEP